MRKMLEDNYDMMGFSFLGIGGMIGYILNPEYISGIALGLIYGFIVYVILTFVLMGFFDIMPYWVKD